MIRITLIAAAALASIAASSPVLAQAGAPVRTLGSSEAVAGATVSIAERKTVPCADKTCGAKPLKRNGYVAAPSLGW